MAGFEQRQFVAAESRLMMVFDLLEQIVEGTNADPATRIAELERRKAAIESDIQRARAGDLRLLDDTQVKDRFLQMAATARGLLSDFRQVEQNFRTLDRAVRERVATWEGGKGALLAEVFSNRDAIASSDQGRSFRAFWDFLMSADRQDQLSSLLESAFALAAVQRSGAGPPIAAHPLRLARSGRGRAAHRRAALRTVAALSGRSGMARKSPHHAVDSRRRKGRAGGARKPASRRVYGIGRSRAGDRSAAGTSVVFAAVQAESVATGGGRGR